MKLVQFNILLRQWMRGGVSTAVSLVSLSLGLICSTVLLLFAVEEFKAADALTPNPTNKYMMLREAWGEKGRFSSGVHRMEIEELAALYPQIVDYAIFKECVASWQDEPMNYYDKTKRGTIAATPSFTKYFKIPMVEGNLDSVLAYPDRVALDKQYAAQLFPDRNPIGQSVKAVYNYDSDTVTRFYTVTAIVDMSKRSMLDFRAIYRYPESERNIEGVEYGQHYAALTLAPGTDPEDIVRHMARNKKLESAEHSGMVIRLDPLNKAYLVDVAITAIENNEHIIKMRDTTSLYIGIAIALAILFIAAFNYINITLTRSASRLKNLAGQRIMGASKWNIRGQIFADTAINVGLAFLLALVFLPISMEGFNSFMNATVSMSDLLDPINVLYELGLLSVLIIIPSVSLIVKFSIHNPLETFKNPEGHRVKALQPLVIAQIVVSVVLLTFGVTVSRQMNHVSSALQNSRQVFQVTASDDNSLPIEFVERVKNASWNTRTAIGSINHYMVWPIRHENKIVDFHNLQVSPEFFGIFDIKLDEGRVFEPMQSESWDSPQNVVVSRSAIKALGIKGSAIGYKFGQNYTIVGVCPDVRVVNAKNETKPLLFQYAEYEVNNTRNLLFRTTGSAEMRIAEMQNIFRETAPAGFTMPNIRTVADVYANKDPEITRMKTMIDVFTIISFLLTAFGLFGLSWYMVERRRREIAIRKTYGATVARMVAMLCRSFLWQSLIAIVIALPAAYFISGYWLEGFVFRVNNAWWVLAATSAISLIVIFATVIGQTIRAALTNPVKYIKTE